MNSTIASPKLLYSGTATPLLAGVAFVVGQHVAVSATLASPGSLEVHVGRSGHPVHPVAWDTTAPYMASWVVDDADIGADSLILQHTLHGQPVSPALVYPLTIKAAPSPAPLPPASAAATKPPAAGGLTPAEDGTPVVVPGQPVTPSPMKYAAGSVNVAKLPVVPWGFVASNKDQVAVIAAGMSRIKIDGGNVLRIWIAGFVAFDAVNLAIIDTAHAAGIKVILCVQPKDDADGGVVNFGAPDIAGWVARNKATLLKLWYAEAGNELNIRQYRPDDFGDSQSWHKPYVDRWLRPLYAALHAIGVLVMCTSVTDSEHPETYGLQAAKLITAGAQASCDGVAVHLYWHLPELATLQPMLIALAAQWGKPLHVTEASLHPATLDADFSAGIVRYEQALRVPCIGSVAIYRGPTHPVWKRCLFDVTGKPTAIYTTVVRPLVSTLA